MPKPFVVQKSRWRMLLMAVPLFGFAYFAGFWIGLWGGPPLGEGWNAAKKLLIGLPLLLAFGGFGITVIIFVFAGQKNIYIINDFGIKSLSPFGSNDYPWDEIAWVKAVSFLQPIPRLIIHLKSGNSFLIQTLHTNQRFRDLVKAVEEYTPVNAG